MTLYQKIDNYLLENHPLTWNTKIVWMLLASFGLHIFFFILGLISYNNTIQLHKYNFKESYSNPYLIAFHLILSIIIGIIWLVYYLRNNAFKNFYRMKSSYIFYEFLQIFILIFSCVTFHFSYDLGFKKSFHLQHDYQRFTKEVETLNKIAPFIYNQSNDLSVNAREIPDPFPVHIEKNGNHKNYYSVDTIYLPYKELKDIYPLEAQEEYVLKKYHVEAINIDKNYNIQSKSYKDASNPDSILVSYKKEQLDISDYIPSEKPSYYNYSTIFYTLNTLGAHMNLKRVNNRKIHRFLDRADKKEFTQCFDSLKYILKKYQIENNLKLKPWMDLSFDPPLFLAKKTIKNWNYSNRNSQAEVVVSATEIVEEVATKGVVEAIGLDSDDLPESNMFVNTDDLKKVFSNIDQMYSSDTIERLFLLHIFAWIALGISLFVFIYRITNLKTVLFSIVSIGIILIIVTLITSLSHALIFPILTYFFILGMSYANTSKRIKGICINISLIGFSIACLFIYQASLDTLRNIFTDDNFHWLTDWETLISMLILILHFTFIFYYRKHILEYKASV